MGEDRSSSKSDPTTADVLKKLELLLALERDVAALRRTVEAMRVEVARIAESGVRFGRDLEMRERGYM
jgi:septum formation topological specificity factor MinE